MCIFFRFVLSSALRLFFSCLSRSFIGRHNDGRFALCVNQWSTQTLVFPTNNIDFNDSNNNTHLCTNYYKFTRHRNTQAHYQITIKNVRYCVNIYSNCCNLWFLFTKFCICSAFFFRQIFSYLFVHCFFFWWLKLNSLSVNQMQ